MIYTATPIAWYSTNFHLAGGEHKALLSFNWLGEQGTAVIDDIECQIRKQGIMNPEWSLEVNGQAISIARKTSVFTSTFEIESPRGLLILKRTSMIGWKFSLESADDWLASIDRTGWFSRKLILDVFDPELDFPIITFACWLRLLIIRRENNRKT